MSKKTYWHRILGLILEPLFKELGYDTRIEEDLSLKRQMVDIVVIRKSGELLKNTTLPKIFWEVFEDLNEHNLLTFKSYSESFNSAACEELYGHLTNYKKINKLKGHKVNLYAIVHHYPQKFFTPYEGTKFLNTIKKDEIFDFIPESLKKIRFIITRTTDNPLLELFSGDVNKVYHGFNKIKAKINIFNEISGYVSQIKYFYGKEVTNMYTKEDFFREFPKTDKPFFYPWEEEYIEKLVEKAREEAEEKANRLAEEKANRLAENILKRGEINGRITLYKEQLSQGIITTEYYNTVLPQLEQNLKELEKESDQKS